MKIIPFIELSIPLNAVFTQYPDKKNTIVQQEWEKVNNLSFYSPGIATQSTRPEVPAHWALDWHQSMEHLLLGCQDGAHDIGVYFSFHSSGIHWFFACMHLTIRALTQSGLFHDRLWIIYHRQDICLVWEHAHSHRKGSLFFIISFLFSGLFPLCLSFLFSFLIDYGLKPQLLCKCLCSVVE